MREVSAAEEVPEGDDSYTLSADQATATSRFSILEGGIKAQPPVYHTVFRVGRLLPDVHANPSSPWCSVGLLLCGSLRRWVLNGQTRVCMHEVGQNSRLRSMLLASPPTNPFQSHLPSDVMFPCLTGFACCVTQALITNNLNLWPPALLKLGSMSLCTYGQTGQGNQEVPRSVPLFSCSV